MASNLNLKITLSADGKQLSGSLKNAQGEVQNFGAQAQQAGDVATNSFSKTRKGVESISTQLSRAQTSLLAFIGISSFSSVISSTVRMADGYGQMAERIRLATSSAADYELVQSRLLDVSVATDRALAEAQELYIQTADSLQSLGYSTSQLLDITDSLSYTFDLNAASSERAASATNAFSRSLQTGRVSALDWQSILLAAPSIVETLAETTGRTTNEIRALGIQGKLSLTDLTEALRLSRDESQLLSEGMDTTVAQAFTRLSIKVGAFIGETNQSWQATQKLAGGIAYLAENLDVLVKVGVVGFVAVAGRYVGVVGAAALTTLQAGKAHLTAAANATTHTGALRALTVAQTAATTAGRGLLAVLGGPVGLILTSVAVAASFIDWGDSAKKAAAGNDLLKASTDKLSSSQAELRLMQLQEPFENAQKKAEDLSRSVAAFQLQLDHTQGAKNQEYWKALLVEAKAELDGVNQELEEHTELQKKLNEIINGRPKPVDLIIVDPEAEKAIASIIDGLAQQELQLRLTEEQYLRYKLAAKGATLEQIEAAAAIHRSNAALKEAQAAQVKQLQAQKKAQEELISKTIDAQEAQDEWVRSMIDAMDPALELEDQIREIEDALQDGLFGGFDEDKVKKYIDGLKKKLAELNDVKINPMADMGDAMQTVAGGIQSVAGAMQGMHEQGTRGYQEMAVAMQAANVIAAVGAVLNQGNGDPYTAFARMATMAAAVTALGVQISMMGGGFTDDAAINQANQGTGTVLGDAAAKSESIANATDITAQATSQLVGINRGMLRALQSMQAGIASATVRIARGADNVDFGSVHTPYNAFNFLSDAGSFATSIPGLKQIDDISLNLVSGLFKGVGKLLGGSSKVTDEGIRILGGTMSDLLEGVTVEAFQTVKSKKYKWSSSKTSENFQALGDDISNQFSLIFESLADSVYQGASALGMVGSDVEKAINEFEIATTKISLKGLSAEEQQKEIEAVFSTIFDGLAGATVGFITDMQRLGEGLGETLARVATSVQVGQEALHRLGFQFAQGEGIAEAQRLNRAQEEARRHFGYSTSEEFYSDANPYLGLMAGGVLNELKAAESAYAAVQERHLQFIEDQARAYDDLVDKAGGMEQFISSMSSFIDKFAPDAHKLDLLTSDMTRALEQAGLAVPATRDAMWELMQTLDATTDSGREQIAALLELADVSDAYYKALEQRAKFERGLAHELEQLDMTPFERSLDDLNNWYSEQIRIAEELGAETVFLERLYARKRADAIEAELDAINQNTDSQLEQLKAEHARAVDSMVAEYQRLVESIHAASASVADAILNIRRQGAGWNEAGYQSGVITDLRGQLGQGSTQDQISTITQLQGAISARYQAEIQASQAAAQAAQQQHQAAQQAAQQRYQAELQAVKAMQQAVQRLHDAADALLLSAASPELLGTQLSEAQRQFSSLLSAAQRGDVEAAGKLQSVGSSYLNIAKDYYAQGSDEYAAIFREVESAYRSVSAPATPAEPKPLPPSPEVLYYQEQDAALQQKAIKELEDLQKLLADLEEQAAAEQAERLAEAEAEQARQHAELLERHREQVNAVNESANRIVAAINAQTAAVEQQRQENQRQNNELQKEVSRMRSELVRTQELANAAKRAV